MSKKPPGPDINKLCLRAVVLLFGCILSLSYGCNCGQAVGRACERDDECSAAAPAIHCYKGVCSVQECEANETRSCFEAAAENQNKGQCKPGKQTCSKSGLWGKCAEQILPRPEICDRVDNDCNGQVDESLNCACRPGTKRRCYNGPVKTLDQGTCRAGIQYCESDNKWGRCLEQSLPSAEVCDKKDNDCNGRVDDNPLCICTPGTTQDCYSGIENTQNTRPCRLGLQVCGAESYWGGECRLEITPQKELCNGIDDDCNGTIDDGVDCGCKPGTTQDCQTGLETPCDKGISYCNSEAKWGPCFVLTIPQSEECGNGKDDDCDGLVDEGCSCKNGETRECYTGPEGTVGVGICKRGTQRCENERWGACTGEQKPEAIDKCDRLDNNCNGEVDEGCACKDGAERECGSDVGTCLKGKQSCKGGQWQSCEGNTPPKTRDDCNGKDDDCDGKVDEDFPTLGEKCEVGLGECKQSGTLICRLDGRSVECNAKASSPGTELCNGKDDDCDGKVDEDFLLLGTACSAGKGLCTNAGTYICNSKGDGTSCNATPTPPQNELCDGVDNNCDGTIDEGCSCTGNSTQACYSGSTGCTRKSDGTYDCTSPCKPGIQRCNGGKWSPCTQEQIPQNEECNGKDDNCDGKVDENFTNLNKPCDVGQGACKATGKYICDPGKLREICDAKASSPTAEECNGKDDDCDGGVDENWPDKGKPCDVGQGECNRKGIYACNVAKTGVTCNVVTGSPKKELCNAKDDDCDGLTDEDFPQLRQPCNVGLGLCARSGFFVCKSDGSIGCSVTPGAPQTETCDGKDNDCNGKVDEGCQCSDGKTQSCYTGSQGCVNMNGTYTCQTPCKAGQQTCAQGKWSTCAGETLPSVEKCDGVDNNCDGQIDESLVRQCNNSCGPGMERCNNGIWAGCNAPTPQTEICDGLDNDCDGQIDENPPCECNSMNQPYRQCYSGPTGTAGVGTCQQGYDACNNGKWSNTCLNQVLPTTEICDNKDNNCNGQVDEMPYCQCNSAVQPYRQCYTGPMGTAGVGTCQQGYDACINGKWSNTCLNQVLPTAEICDGKDNDCNGQTDEGNVCNYEDPYIPDSGVPDDPPPFDAGTGPEPKIPDPPPPIEAPFPVPPIKK